MTTDATAADQLEAGDTEADVEQQTETGERDYDAEARAMGWRPQEEFSGDPKQFIDAKTFVERGEQFLPILKAQNKNLLSKVKQQDRVIAEVREYLTKVEQTAYDRAVRDLKARQIEAVETGDVQAFRQIDEQLNDLNKAAAAKKPEPSGDAETLQEALIEWRVENPWYNPEARDTETKLMSDYADLVARKLGARETVGMEPREYLDAIAERVRERFPKAFAKPGTAPAGKSPRAEAPTRGSGKPGGKTFADLPVDAQKQADRFVKMGVLKSRDDYVKSYAW